MALEAHLLSFKELRDPERRAALYSDLSVQRDENPEWYEECVILWKKIIISCAEKGLLSSSNSQNLNANQTDKSSSATLHEIGYDSEGIFTCLKPKSLEAKFHLEDDAPTSLNDILNELVNDKTLVPLSLFLKDQNSVGNIGWLFRWLLGSPKAAQNLNQSSENYVIAPVVKTICNKILQAQKQRCVFSVTDDVFTKTDFQRIFFKCMLKETANFAKIELNQDILMNETDYQVISSELKSQKKLITVYSKKTNCEVVKFVESTEKMPQISLLDIKVVGLVSSSEKISTQIEMLEKKVQETQNSLKLALEKKQKTIALARLRLVKHIEQQVLPPRYKAFETLQGIISQLQSSASDAEHLEVIKSGAEALALLRQENGLTPGKVTETFDQLASVLADQSEVEQVMCQENESIISIGSGVSSGTGSDTTIEAELEAELEQLVIAQQTEEEKRIGNAISSTSEEVLQASVQKTVLSAESSKLDSNENSSASDKNAKIGDNDIDVDRNGRSQDPISSTPKLPVKLPRPVTLRANKDSEVDDEDNESDIVKQMGKLAILS